MEEVNKSSKLKIIVSVVFFATFFLLVLTIGFAYYDSNRALRYRPTISTQVYDINNQLIATLTPGHKHRIFISLNNIPKRFIEALLAIEDHTFYNHFGISVTGIFRSLKANLFSMSKQQGGSTITQQLVKNITLHSNKSWIRKIREINASIIVDAFLSKNEILERYINEVYFGYGHYGFDAAAKGYFRKNLRQLSLKEFSTLLAVLKAPTRFNPVLHKQASLKQANIFLIRYLKLGLINKSQWRFEQMSIPKIYKPHFPGFNRFPYVIDYLKRRLKKINSNYTTEIKQIFLTIDTNVQVLAQKELTYGANNVVYSDKTDFNGALVSIKHETGEILALVGGVNRDRSQFNRVFQMKRQIGSTVKPFIYLCALENSIKKTQPLINVPIRFYYQTSEGRKLWVPRNTVPQITKYTTFEQALIQSKNVATVDLALNKISLAKVSDCMKKYQWQGKIEYPSAVLGSIEMSPIEMVRLYSMFPNDSNRQVLPYIVRQVVDKNDNITSYPKKRLGPGINKKYRLIIKELLHRVVTEGSARIAQSPLVKLGAKTGTSDKNRDIWIAAFQKELLTVVWLGNDSGKPIPDEQQAGGRMPARIIKAFYENLTQINLDKYAVD